MKKKVAVFIISLILLMIFISFYHNILKAQEGNSSTNLVDNVISVSDVKAEKLVSVQLVNELSKIKSFPLPHGMGNYDINPLLLESNQVQDYILTKSYTFHLADDWNCSGIQRVFVTMLRSNEYTMENVNMIVAVYDSNFILSQDPSFLESSNSYVNSWNSNNVKTFWSGNICRNQDNNRIERKYTTVETIMNCPQW